MADFKPFNLGQLRTGLVAWGKDIADKAEAIVEETVQEAAGDMVGVIYAATTPTGERRLATGGVAGRVESGQMVGDVKAETERRDDEIIGRWGWTEEFAKYYGYQESGTRFIEGMDALGGSFVRAEDRLKARLRAVR